MPDEEFNLPINEMSLQGVSQAVLVAEPPAEAIDLLGDPTNMQRRLWFLYPLVALGSSAISG